MEAEGRLRELAKQVEDTALSNHQLNEALRKAEENLTNMEAAEEVAHEGRAALAELQTLLEGLGAHSTTATTPAPDAKTTLRLLREGVKAAASGLKSFGNSCVQVSWTMVLRALRSLGIPDLPRVVPEMERLAGECREAGGYTELQSSMQPLVREIGSKFWVPFG